jgi:serine/threonine-protein kinase
MTARLTPGARIGGYEVVRLLGEGGMGAVYEARDAAGRSVALKVLLAGSFAGEEARRRFIREGRAAAAVAHANVTRVHAAGEDGGRLFIVFELVRGGSVGKVLQERGRYPWREAVEVAVGIARGLEAIHAAGIVHRDLKPDNVLLDEEGRPKITDLGLARQVSSTSAALTGEGELLGTPYFMAPEQVDQARSVDHRADLYALGSTLFMLLAGAPPFAGSGGGIILDILQKDPPRVRTLEPSVPAALDDLVARCLAKDPAKRPASAREVAERLAAIGAGETTERASLALPIGALVLVAALGAGGLAFVSRSAPPVPVEPPRPADPATRAREALALAEACEERHDRAGAVAAASSALALEPKLAKALAVRGAAFVDAGKFAEALRDAKAALDLDRDCALAYLVRGETLAHTPERGRVDKAFDALEADIDKARSLAPSLPRIASLEALWLRLHHEGREKCEKKAEEASRVDPGSPWGPFVLGEIAIEDADQAPTNDERLRLFLVALEHENEGLERDPGHGRLLQARAYVFFRLGRTAEALADAEAAVRSWGTWESYYLRGCILFNRRAPGDLEACLRDMKETVAHVPMSGVAGPWVVEGETERLLGRLDEAEQTLREGLRNDVGDQDDAHLHLTLARVYRQSGQNHYALDAYRDALEKSDGARNARQRLDAEERAEAERGLHELEKETGGK